MTRNSVTGNATLNLLRTGWAVDESHLELVQYSSEQEKDGVQDQLGSTMEVKRAGEAQMLDEHGKSESSECRRMKNFLYKPWSIVFLPTAGKGIGVGSLVTFLVDKFKCM